MTETSQLPPEIQAIYQTADEMVTSAQQQLDSAQQTYDRARDTYVAQTPGATPQGFGETQQAMLLEQQLNGTMGGLRSAHRAAASLYTRAQSMLFNASRRQEVPQERRQLWADEAQAAAVRANVAQNHEAMLEAREPAVADHLKAQTASLLASAETRNALRPGEVAALNARTALYGKQAELTSAREGYTQAQSDRLQAITPAEVDKLVAQGVLDQARAEKIKAEQDLSLDNLRSKGYLNDAKIAQIRQKLSVPLPVNAPGREPYITSRDPTTGAIRTDPNPNFFQQQSAAFQRHEESVQLIHGLIASGKMSPAEGENYMALMRGALQAELNGTTPFQEQKNQQDVIERQATFARGLLDQRASRADAMANTLVNAARNAHMLHVPQGLAPFSAAFQDATAMGGGQSVYDTAQQMLDRMKTMGSPYAAQMEALMAKRMRDTGSPLPPDVHAQLIGFDTSGPQGGVAAQQWQASQQQPADALLAGASAAQERVAPGGTDRRGGV